MLGGGHCKVRNCVKGPQALGRLRAAAAGKVVTAGTIETGVSYEKKCIFFLTTVRTF